MKKVAIIIPTYNDGNRLEKCLDALSKQSYPKSLIRVLVVDNNSTENIADLVAKYENCVYLSEEKPGAYCARNHALQALTDEHIVGFTDADCIPSIDWISNAVAEIENRELVAVGGMVSVFCESGGTPNLIENYEILFAFPQKLYVEQDHFAVTANLFITRQALDLVGPFNESLFSGGDAEWGNRMREKGVPLAFSPEIAVAHPARDTLEKIVRKVKRTVGGCYSQRHVNPVMKNSFSTMSLLRGFVPPIIAYKKLVSGNATLPMTSKIRLAFLLLYLKYHKNMMKILYRMNLIKDFERF